MPFTLTMPKLSPTMEEGTIAKWHKKEGEKVEAGELLFEVATDKATVEYNALDEGWLRKILVADGVETAVNQPIAIFTETQEESLEGYAPQGIEQKKEKRELFTETEEPQTEIALSSQKQEEETTRILASPLARRLAKERKIDLRGLKGSGPNKRIMSRDLEKASSLQRNESPRSTIPAGTYREEALTPMRKAIAQRLQESKATIPHFYVEQEINVEPLLSLRAQLAELEISVSINDCLVKGIALALRAHPIVNSGFHAAAQKIIRFETVDISIAVSVENGLITPIVSQADEKRLVDISAEIKDLAQRAKAGKLEEREYRGGSFTLSNLGMYGITRFAAIINPPQAAILAVSGIRQAPVVKEGKILPGQLMSLCLSADHRAIDGVAAAQFLKTAQKILENPAGLLL